MNKKANIYRLLFAILFLLILSIGILFLTNSPKRDISAKEVENSNLCVTDSDCNNQDSCTISTCRQGVCKNTKVILCYQNDGCCPKNCNPTNDNDCT